MFKYEDELEEEMQDLETAEEFLEFFGIEFDAPTVHVNRLHILQRFHDYVGEAELSDVEAERREVYKAMMNKAYKDFVDSDAISERVFKVLQDAVNPSGFVSIDMIAK